MPYTAKKMNTKKILYTVKTCLNRWISYFPSLQYIPSLLN